MMRKLYKLLFKRSTHIKPVDNGLFSDIWVTAEYNLIEAFVDDVRRYGWAVAFHNLRMQLHV